LGLFSFVSTGCRLSATHSFPRCHEDCPDVKATILCDPGYGFTGGSGFDKRIGAGSSRDRVLTRRGALELMARDSLPEALLEREVLSASSEACGQFFDRYFDERGWLLCVERWGGDDGPDDAIENCNDWPW
jgi:hypothetical protein